MNLVDILLNAIIAIGILAVLIIVFLQITGNYERLLEELRTLLELLRKWSTHSE